MVTGEWLLENQITVSKVHEFMDDDGSLKDEELKASVWHWVLSWRKPDC